MCVRYLFTYKHRKEPELSQEFWRGTINLILYSIQFTTELDNTKADAIADAIVEYRTFSDGPQVFLEALQAALDSETVILTPDWSEPAYGREDLRRTEGEIRQFLHAVVQRLIHRQPWPSMPNRQH